MMFDARCDHVIPSPRHSKYGEIVSLGAPARENNFRRAAVQQPSHGFPRTLDRCPRLLSMTMQRRGVTKLLAKVRLHGLKNLWQHRSGRVVIKIDPAHDLASILPGTRLQDEI